MSTTLNRNNGDDSKARCQVSNAMIPSQPRELAAWFAEAVRAEIPKLEREGGERRYELHGGHRVSSEEARFTVYRFALADTALVPEDASGTLEIEGRSLKATIVSQDSNHVEVQVEAAEATGPFVARAMLLVDDLGLLRKLTDALEAVTTGADSVSALAAAIFHPDANGACAADLPEIPALNRITGEQRAVIEQACGSEVTFVWGPPGTGKTYVIAHLITALVARGERVLMASHTHAAVDQAVYETVKREGGPLSDSEMEQHGEIVRIGRVTDPNIPDTVRLDAIVESRTQAIHAEISDLQRHAQPLCQRRAHLRAELAEWNRLSEMRQRMLEIEHRTAQATGLAEQKAAERTQAARRVDTCKSRVERAHRAWFFRESRLRQARVMLDGSQRHLTSLSNTIARLMGEVHEAEQAAESLRMKIRRQSEARAHAQDADSLCQELAPIESRLTQIDDRLADLRARLDQIERDVLSQARIVASTLTKCYVGNSLDGQLFDALIVDEISMALPPLLFIAACRISRRVILVGDFMQLPPIVRGGNARDDNDICSKRLGQDIFHLAGVARDLKQTNHPALARLSTQRRMVPAIANAARFLSYESARLLDHPDVLKRERDIAESFEWLWLRFLPNTPLVVVDTADLHCWSGRQAGSLSRFNLYSAQIAVDVARLAAGGLARNREEQPRIGIVTPFTAQSRLLRRLTAAMDLDDVIRAGTVHTFQGGQADLVIFDTVLDEPHWTARLCNPNRAKEVRRDLNVVLTRARSKFVLIGSSEWLNRHAKPASALGQLWYYLKNHADLVPASEVIGKDLSKRVALQDGPEGVPVGKDLPTHMILNEVEFFQYFSNDLREAKESVFGLVAYFGENRWPQIEPMFRAAIDRGVEITLVTPPPTEAQNKGYVEKAIRSMRNLGAVIVYATGLHGKDIVIDERIHYTGSLNLASHRGRAEIMHRTEDRAYAKTVLEHLQARHIRSAGGSAAVPRECPRCRGPVQVVNERRSLPPWDKQPMKIGCVRYGAGQCEGYLVSIDERASFAEPPVCEVDQRTKYRRVRRGRGERWECPKHPRTCRQFKVVPGDP